MLWLELSWGFDNNILMKTTYSTQPNQTIQTKPNHTDQTKPNQMNGVYPIFILKTVGTRKRIVLTEILPCQCCQDRNLEFVWSSMAYMVEQRGLYGCAKSFSHQTQLKVRLGCIVVGVELGF